MLRYQEGSASTAAREEGFLGAVRKTRRRPGHRLRQPVRRRHDRERLRREREPARRAEGRRGRRRPASSARTSRPPSACSSRCRRRGSPARSSSSASTPRRSSSRACATGAIDALVVQSPFLMGDLAVHAIVDSSAATRRSRASTRACACHQGGPGRPGREGAPPPRPEEVARGVTRSRSAACRKAFGATVALDGVDLAVPPGQIHALVGENGAGKSTLLKILAGAQRRDAGEIALDGAPYRPRRPEDARRAGVAMVHQELSLCPHLTVAENILLGVEPSRFGFVRRAETRPPRRRRAGPARLDLAPRQPWSAICRPRPQQLVEIARALARPTPAARAASSSSTSPPAASPAPTWSASSSVLRRLRARGRDASSTSPTSSRR